MRHKLATILSSRPLYRYVPLCVRQWFWKPYLKAAPDECFKATPIFAHLKNKEMLIKRCPNGHQRSQLETFCGHCGAKMVKVVVQQCACGARRFGGDDYCTKCGAKFFEEYKEA